jgi:hypothetical protein
MAQSRLKAMLDYSATVGMIVASVVLVAVALGRPAERGDYDVGDRFESSAVLASDLSGRRSVVMFLKTDCPFCVQSRQLYKQISDKAQSTRLVIVGYETRDVLRRRYVEEYGLDADIVATIEYGHTRLRGTPTVLVLDAASRVVSVWRGRLSQADEARLLAQID